MFVRVSSSHLSYHHSLVTPSTRRDRSATACSLSPTRRAASRARAQRSQRRATPRSMPRSPPSTRRAPGSPAARTHCKAPIPRHRAARPSAPASWLLPAPTASRRTRRRRAARPSAAREFAAARNAEINASMAAVQSARAREFAAARNAEINASIAAVEAERARQFAAARNAESTPHWRRSQAARRQTATQTPELQAWVDALNAQYEKSPLPWLATPKLTPRWRPSRPCGSSSTRATPRSTPRWRPLRPSAPASSPQPRNAEINASMAAVEAERTRSFAAARNAEINASLAAVNTRRARVRAGPQC